MLFRSQALRSAVPKRKTEKRPYTTAVPAQARLKQLPSLGKTRSHATPRPHEGRLRQAGLLARGSRSVLHRLPKGPANRRLQWLCDARTNRLQLRGQPGFHTRVPFSSSTSRNLSLKGGISPLFQRVNEAACLSISFLAAPARAKAVSRNAVRKIGRAHV